MSLRSRRDAGLTLIELVVVLLILVALAGAIIPILLNFKQRAHGAAGTDQLVEATKWVTFYEVERGTVPNSLDSLLEGDGTALSTTPYGGLETDTGGAVTDGLDVIALTTESLAALNGAGITTVIAHPASFEHATKDASTSGGGASYTLTDTDSLLGLSATNPQIAALGLPAGGVYVVLGLGPDSTLVTSKQVLSAPVHFGEDDTPEENYKRLVLVFQIVKDDGGTPETLEKARFVGAFAIHADGELEGVDNHIFEYHESLPVE